MSLYTEYTPELDHAVEQVCSAEYVRMFENVAKGQHDMCSYEQHVMLNDYPNKITWYIGERRQEIINRFRSIHLKWFSNWLSEHNTGRPPYLKWNSTMIHVMLHLKNSFFRIDCGDIVDNNDTREEFQKIADIAKRILLAIRESNPTTIDQDAIPLVRELLQILFYFTLDTDLAIYLKSLQLVDLMNELIKTSNDDNEIHLQAYRILAVIMAEADIKQLQNASGIAAVFISFIEDTIDSGAAKRDRLHNSLRSLTVLTQHDQIRTELIKQKGYELFIRCVVEPEFNNLLKAKLPALEILLALSFDKDFATSLKDNTMFMEHARLLSSSAEQSVKRVASTLIWKLETESDTAGRKVQDKSSLHLKPMTSEEKYDIMISYSHEDKELCHSIYERLKKDQLRVWIDFEHIRGNLAENIANAIENSKIVLICMSDSYKKSSVCESEAAYANQRDCCLIPLKMTLHYKPDGWLGLLTSKYIYVDFKKSPFEKAYEELRQQMQRNQTNVSLSTTVKQQQQMNHDHASVITTVPEIHRTVLNNNEPARFIEYPHCIDKWTEEHVTSFLLDKKLNVLLGAFKGMNGRLLHKAYDMCQANQQAMFSSLKEDVSQSHHKGILNLKDYLTFLEEIKAYIPYTTKNQLNPTSAVCSLM